MIVYVNVHPATNGADPIKTTKDRDEVLEDHDGIRLDRLYAVLYRCLPSWQWDRWLDSKMVHPFYSLLRKIDGGGYVPVSRDTAKDLLRGFLTAIPCGDFR